MRLSEYFLPLLRENPSEAQIVSHRLMLRAGMIRQSSAGIYSWLPLGLRVLKNVEQIVREEQDRAGAQEILMPTIQPAELWRESGRYDDYGKEMLRIRDRHDREMLYGPTNEEHDHRDRSRQSVKSYRELPQIALSHPVEIPRRGAAALRRDARARVPDEGRLQLRSRRCRRRHSLPQDDVVPICAPSTRMGLKAIPMRAETGPIGGDLSHEFIILRRYRRERRSCSTPTFLRPTARASMSRVAEAPALQQVVNRYTALYAATDDDSR